MRVTNVSYTRVVSDSRYGNHQATVHAELAEGDDPAACLAEVARLACEGAERKLREEEERLARFTNRLDSRLRGEVEVDPDDDEEDGEPW